MRLKYTKLMMLMLFMLGVLWGEQDYWESISKRPTPNGGPPLREFYRPQTEISDQMRFVGPQGGVQVQEVRDGFRVVSDTTTGPDNRGFIVPQASRQKQVAYLRGMADLIIPRLKYRLALAQQDGDFELAEQIENDITLARRMLEAAENGDEEKLNILAQQCSPVIIGLVDTVKKMPAVKPPDADRFYFQIPEHWKTNKPPILIPTVKRDGTNPPLARSVESMYRSPTTIYVQVVHHKDDAGDQMWTETDIVYNITLCGWTYTTGEISSDDNDFDCDVMVAATTTNSSEVISLEAWDSDGGWTGDDQLDLRWGSGYTAYITYYCDTKLWSGDATVPYTRGDDSDDWAKCWFSISSSYDDDVGQRATSWHFVEDGYRSGDVINDGWQYTATVIQNNGGQVYEAYQFYSDQYYKFYVQSGDYFCITIDPFSGGGVTEEDIDLYLYDPDNLLRGSSTNGGGSADQVCITADKTGWWYIRTNAATGYASWFDMWFSDQLVNDYNVVGVGPVSSPWSDRGYLVHYYSDGSQSCYYYKDEDDWYKVYLPASSGRRLRVIMTPQSGSRDFDLYVYRPDGSLLGSSLNAGDASETVTGEASAAGWYYFKVHYFSGDGGYYTFSLDTACIDYSGTYTSQNITPPPSGCEYQWSQIVYNQTLNSGTIVLEILDGSGSPIPGYSYSSSSDGTVIWNLSGLNTEDYPSIRLRANFSTCGGPYPQLHDWEVKWNQYGTGSQAIWIGGVSTAWSNPNNWYCNMPPDATKDVIISTVYIDTYMPTVDITTAVCRDIAIGTGTTLTISGSNKLTCRDVTIESGGEIDMTGSGAMDVSGNWTNDGLFNCGTGTVTFTGTAVKNIQGTNATTFYNLTVAGGTVQLQLDAYVDGDFVNNATFDQQGHTFYVRGDFTNNGTFSAGTGGITYFDGSSDQNIYGSTEPQFYNLYLNKAGTAVILNQNISVYDIEDFSAPSGSSMRLNGYRVHYGP